jgi:hypothetical protein
MGAPVKWITNPCRTIRSQLVFDWSPKFEETRLKNGEKIGNRQTERQD